MLLAAWAIVPGLAVNLAADDAKRPPSGSSAKQSLDDQLLEGLDNTLLEGLDTNSNGKPADAAGAADVGKSKPQRNSSDPLDDELLRDLGGEDISGNADASPDPLVGIGRRMRSVESRLAGKQLDDQTKQLQKQILDDLSALMQECKKQCQGGGSSPSPRSGKPSSAAQAGKSPATAAPRDSSGQLRERKTERADRKAITNAMKESWGHLPERARQQISNSATDEFLPKYERMLEKYFKRLAEEDLDRP
jgi:hypothetical protein